jgi:hypothetical protein
MSGDLDDIRINVDCPHCGASITTTYGAAKVAGVAGCICGNVIEIDLQHSDIAAVDKLIDEANPHVGKNDNDLFENDDPLEPDRA